MQPPSPGPGRALSQSIYASPLRVYLCLGLLALIGVICGLSLPVSLFPNSSRPLIHVSLSYGGSTADDFLQSYGNDLEWQLRNLSTDNLKVEKVSVSYSRDRADFDVLFAWGAEPRSALREVQTLATAFGSRLPRESQDSIWVDNWSENSGFFALSFYSDKRSLDELYAVLKPIIDPRVGKVPDAKNPGLWNPAAKELRVELKLEQMASLGLFPRDIERQLLGSLDGYTGGSLTVGSEERSIVMPRPAQSVKDLAKIPITTPKGSKLHLGDLAHIDLVPSGSNTQLFKTSGQKSIMLWANPRPGGNVKRMSEDLLKVVDEVRPLLPPDVKTRTLVDPSEFIQGAVDNVLHEVLLGALLAVLVLYLFIGSLKNTITAAIEIPLSMILAFILMKISGMNLNLISLGGLALSAGMNVDASVVVMENIFRHFEGVTGVLSFREKLARVRAAVSEVRFAVLASTVSSLVVFAPLAFSSELTYAILGDLAKTVVFSHGLSALVALLLVPTVRLHLMRGNAPLEVHRSPIERHLIRLETFYVDVLQKMLRTPRYQKIFWGTSAGALVLLAILILPRLPREVLGAPDTDWLVLNVRTEGNVSIGQMEAVLDETERKLMSQIGGEVAYTFSESWSPNGGNVMARLKNKRHMRKTWTELESKFLNSATVRYSVRPWNPSELPLPNPPDMRLVLNGGTLASRTAAGRELIQLIEESKAFPRVWTRPELERRKSVVLRPNLEQWSVLREQNAHVSPADVADVIRVASHGRNITKFLVDGQNINVSLRYNRPRLDTVEDLEALPLGVSSKILPLKALTHVSVEDLLPVTYREDGQELSVIEAKQVAGKEHEVDASLKKVQDIVRDFEARTLAPAGAASLIGTDALAAAARPTLSFDDSKAELNKALRQLATALALSILLIFLTLVMQFGDVGEALVVMVAIPLGFIGVLVALFVFRSTLSLNSVLGVILLNGIAVANSIILVDFIKRLVLSGLSPETAALEAARKRLRPILITSLTTILGMLPIALGFGEGGRILQPLGITVSGGLWVSMALTLVAVPLLQVKYLSWKSARQSTKMVGWTAAASSDSGFASPFGSDRKEDLQ